MRKSPPRDEQGRLFPDPIRFPSGFKALGDYMHNQCEFLCCVLVWSPANGIFFILRTRVLTLQPYGLFLGFFWGPPAVKFAIYTAESPHTCAGYPASAEHEQVDAATFNSWGVDYVKVRETSNHIAMLALLFSRSLSLSLYLFLYLSFCLSLSAFSFILFIALLFTFFVIPRFLRMYACTAPVFRAFLVFYSSHEHAVFFPLPWRAVYRWTDAAITPTTRRDIPLWVWPCSQGSATLCTRAHGPHTSAPTSRPSPTTP